MQIMKPYIRLRQNCLAAAKMARLRQTKPEKYKRVLNHWRFTVVFN